MKITDLTLTLFTWDTIPPTTYGRHTRLFGGKSELGLLTLATDEGLEGHAFLGSAIKGASADADSLVKYLKPVVMGQDPLERERLYRELWSCNRLTSVRAIGAVDIALWDLAGKVAGLPIHQLIGTCRQSAPAYASSAVLSTPEDYAENALAFQAEGWSAYKIHPPTRWREDIAICRAVRKAVGDDYTLMLDSTWSYKFPEALRVGRAIEELGFYWYEDPLDDDDIYNSAKLRQKLEIPLLCTEYPYAGLPSYVPWILLQATDYLRGDVAVKGGITSILKGAHLAEAFHLNFEVHHGGNSLNNLANLHVIMAIPNTEFFEVLLPHGAHKYGVINEIVVDNEGLVHAPNGPGLGAQIDFDLIKKKKIAVLK